MGRAAAYDAIVRGEPFKTPNIPASFHVLVNELKGLALDIDLKGVVSSPDDDEADTIKSRSKERMEEFIEAEEKTAEKPAKTKRELIGAKGKK